MMKGNLLVMLRQPHHLQQACTCQKNRLFLVKNGACGWAPHQLSSIMQGAAYTTALCNVAVPDTTLLDCS